MVRVYIGAYTRCCEADSHKGGGGVLSVCNGCAYEALPPDGDIHFHWPNSGDAGS